MSSARLPGILLKIIETKNNEVDSLKPALSDLKKAVADTEPALNFARAFDGPGLSVIAEIKKASPSAGIISREFNPVNTAKAYSAAADAVSVLTDRVYFKGKPEYISAVRPFLPGIPVLMKDFIIDETQIYKARALGADSFLLISAILEPLKLKAFIALGRSMGMEPLVESHDERELEKARGAGAGILGVNNRNLYNFDVDISTAEKLGALIPADALKVAESGIHTINAAARMACAGYDAILVGESLMMEGISVVSEKIRLFKEAGA